MNGALTPPGPAHDGSGTAPYLIGSTESDLLTELAGRLRARWVSTDLLTADLTHDQVRTLRDQYAGRAMIEPDVPLGPFAC